eukprot:GFYU01011333.1.p1 GENE.GFYU01011333.1~~GFYU01011333.1.p1  ORF type:complete len:198 (+),score=24.14 GFYU01011333.1:101-694(+)
MLLTKHLLIAAAMVAVTNAYTHRVLSESETKGQCFAKKTVEECEQDTTCEWRTDLPDCVKGHGEVFERSMCCAAKGAMAVEQTFNRRQWPPQWKDGVEDNDGGMVSPGIDNKITNDKNQRTIEKENRIDNNPQTDEGECLGLRDTRGYATRRVRLLTAAVKAEQSHDRKVELRCRLDEASTRLDALQKEYQEKCRKD